jgi:hypothetical protein
MPTRRKTLTNRRLKLSKVNLYGLPPVASLETKLRLAAVFFPLHINIALDDGLRDAHG